MDAVVIGGSGLIGSYVVRRLKTAGHQAVGTYYRASTPETSVQIDKRHESEVLALILEKEPDLVVDTAAFHDVDECESRRDEAWSVNATGTQNVAVAANEVDAHIVYISTDYVFSGDPERAPYAEGDAVSPVNYYGMSKYAGEQAVKIADQWTILRSSVIYDSCDGNFFTWARKELDRNKGIEVVDDQVGTPTYAPDVAEACIRVGERGLTGLFHAGGPQSISRYEFVKRLAEHYGYHDVTITPISTGELGQEAARPPNSSLSSTKLYRTLDYTFRSPRTAFESIRSNQCKTA